MTATAHLDIEEAVVFGTGRLGTTLASMLAAAGVRIRLLVGRRPIAAHLVPEQLPRHSLIEDPRDNLSSALASLDHNWRSLVCLAVSDDGYAELVDLLGELVPRWQGINVLIFSGGAGLAVLDPLRGRGARTGMLHPCVPIFSAAAALPPGICYTYAGPPQLGEVCAALVERWRGELVRVPESLDHGAYHAGAVLAAGHLVTLLAASRQLLAAAGLDEQAAAAVSSSIANQVLAIIDGRTLAELPSRITGPFVRGDEKLIERHLVAIRSTVPELEAAYTALGEHCRRLLSG